MRYLGVDFGTKRVGLALSDEEGNFVYPLSVITNSPNLVKEILTISSEKKVGEIVVGESQDFSFKDNAVMKDILALVGELRKTGSVPVVLHPEFLTSEEAKRLQGENDMLDASAAALILKNYLETKQNGKQ